MPFFEVRQPVHILEAFSRMDDAAILSQAAILLILGARLRGESVVNLPSTALLEPSPDEEDNDLAALGIPHLRPTFGRVDTRRLQTRLRNRYGAAPLLLAENAPSVPLVMQDIANRLVRSPEDVAAAEMMEVALFHPHGTGPRRGRGGLFRSQFGAGSHHEHSPPGD